MTFTDPLAFLSQAAAVLQAGGPPAWRLTALLALLLLGIGFALHALLDTRQRRRDHRRAAALRARRAAARRHHGEWPATSTFSGGQSGLRKAEAEWAHTLAQREELAALARPRSTPRRQAPQANRWDLPTRPAQL